MDHGSHNHHCKEHCWGSGAPPPPLPPPPTQPVQSVVVSAITEVPIRTLQVTAVPLAVILHLVAAEAVPSKVHSAVWEVHSGSQTVTPVQL